MLFQCKYHANKHKNREKKCKTEKTEKLLEIQKM